MVYFGRGMWSELLSLPPGPPLKRGNSMQSKKPCSIAKIVFASFVTFSLVLVVVPSQSQAQTFKVLHTFRGAPADGEGPFGGLIRDSAGNLYGTTTSGGRGKCKSGCGTAFKLDKTGKVIWLHSFGGKDGREPLAGLFRDNAGSLYGTTVEGGAHCYGSGFPGCGTVFELSKTGKETLLYSFAGVPDAYFPEALLVGDAARNLYGTTFSGGAFDNAGTVFKVDSRGHETVLYSFCSLSNCADGNSPYPGVIRDAAGNLYGVTSGGGNYGAGAVFELGATGSETVLYSFAGGSDGADPFSVLVADESGNLYGTTRHGGNGECGGSGCGVIFELSPNSDGSWTESVLYAFCSLSGCADGEEPIAGPLVRDAAGNLYGTTFFGGAHQSCDEGAETCGVVFKLDIHGRETVLHSFTGGKDGAYPWAGLTMGSAGSLYGVATGGGDTACYPPNGCGVVFKITP